MPRNAPPTSVRAPRPSAGPHRDLSARFTVSRSFPAKYASASAGLSGVPVPRGAAVVRLSGAVFAPAFTNSAGTFEAVEPAAWAAFACRIADGRVVRRDGFGGFPCETLRDLGADTFAGFAAWLAEAAPAGAVLYAKSQTHDPFTDPANSLGGPSGSAIYSSPDGERIKRATGQDFSGEVVGWQSLGAHDAPTVGAFTSRILAHLYAAEPLRG